MGYKNPYSKTIQIRVSRDTHRQLVDRGNLDDTFDSVIKRLLDEGSEVAAEG